MEVVRFPLPAAYADPAFRKCAMEAICTPEMVENFNRLYGATLGMTERKPHEDDLRAFSEFVHDCIYTRLSDEAIEALRVTAERAA